MAKTTNRVEWEFLLNQRELDRGLRKAQTGFKNTEQSSTTLQKAMGGLTKAVGVLGLTFGAREILNFGIDAIKAASDYDEAVNAIEVSSGSASEEIIEFSRTAAESIGLSETAVLDAGVAFSGFADKIASEDRVAATFEEYITRATDIGSVLNLTTSDALAKFQSALAGESEPLRRFGIDISAAAVATFALQEGIIGVGDTMSEDDKVLARYGLLMQDTDKFAGDFAATSDGLANSTKILAAEYENAQVELGANLIPLQERWNDLMRTGVSIMGDVATAMSDKNKEEELTLLLLWEDLEATGQVTGSLEDMIAAQKDNKKSSEGLGRVWDILTGRTNNLDHALLEAQEATDEMSGATEDLASTEQSAQAANDAYVDNMLAIAGATDDATDAQKTLQQVMKEGLDPVAAAIGSYQKFQATLEKVDEDGARSAEEMLELAKAVLDVESQFASLTPDDINGALRSLSSALGISEGKARRLLVELGLLDGKNVDVTVRTTFKSFGVVPQNVGTNADGGVVNAGETSLVGERGPEFITAGSSLRVHPNGTNPFAGGGGVTNIFNINALDPQAAAEAVRDALEYSINTQGPIQVG